MQFTLEKDIWNLSQLRTMEISTTLSGGRSKNAKSAQPNTEEVNTLGFSRHEWPLMCCICFEGLEPATCAIDHEGKIWDVCKGQCALESGLIGTPVKIVEGVYAPEYGWLAGIQGKGYLIAMREDLQGLKLFCRRWEVRGVVD